MSLKYATITILIAVTVGCSASPTARREIALLRSEIVDLENQYYALKSMYRDETGRDPDFSDFGSSRGGGWLSHSSEDVCATCGEIHDPQLEYDHPTQLENNDRVVPDSRQAPDNLQPPIIEPVEDPESGTVPSDGKSTGFSRPTRNGISNAPKQNRRGSSKPLLDTSSSLTGIEIDSQQTISYDNDGVPGDDGVAVAIRPVFDGGVELGSIGELAISVIDPSLPQERQRLGLWKFTPVQVDSMLRQESGNHVIQVRLPWQNGPASGDSLLIFARVRTVDGRMLENSSSFQVDNGNPAGTNAEEIDLDSPEDPPITSGASQGRNQPAWRPIR